MGLKVKNGFTELPRAMLVLIDVFLVLHYAQQRGKMVGVRGGDPLFLQFRENFASFKCNTTAEHFQNRGLPRLTNTGLPRCKNGNRGRQANRIFVLGKQPQRLGLLLDFELFGRQCFKPCCKFSVMGCLLEKDLGAERLHG